MEVLGTLSAKSKQQMLKLYAAERHDAIDWYFHVILIITLYKVVLTCNSVDETKPWCVTIQMTSPEQYFHVVLYVALRGCNLKFSYKRYTKDNRQ